LRIYVTGKLNGKMRRKTYSFKTGELAVQQLNTNLDYFKSTSFTKFGVLSIKV
jgi:ribosomal protein S3